MKYKNTQLSDEEHTRIVEDIKSKIISGELNITKKNLAQGINQYLADNNMDLSQAAKDGLYSSLHGFVREDRNNFTMNSESNSQVGESHNSIENTNIERPYSNIIKRKGKNTQLSDEEHTRIVEDIKSKIISGELNITKKNLAQGINQYLADNNMDLSQAAKDGLYSSLHGFVREDRNNFTMSSQSNNVELSPQSSNIPKIEENETSKEQLVNLKHTLQKISVVENEKTDEQRLAEYLQEAKEIEEKTKKDINIEAKQANIHQKKNFKTYTVPSATMPGVKVPIYGLKVGRYNDLRVKINSLRNKLNSNLEEKITAIKPEEIKEIPENSTKISIDKSKENKKTTNGNTKSQETGNEENQQHQNRNQENKKTHFNSNEGNKKFNNEGVEIVEDYDENEVVADVPYIEVGKEKEDNRKKQKIISIRKLKDKLSKFKKKIVKAALIIGTVILAMTGAYNLFKPHNKNQNNPKTQTEQQTSNQKDDPSKPHPTTKSDPKNDETKDTTQEKKGTTRIVGSNLTHGMREPGGKMYHLDTNITKFGSSIDTNISPVEKNGKKYYHTVDYVGNELCWITEKQAKKVYGEDVIKAVNKEFYGNQSRGGRK